MSSDLWWKAKGFAENPELAIATGGEIVYRVGGGPSNLAFGSFFSPLKASCVSEAEARANLVTWGNRCYYVATYRVKRGTRMWVGRVAPESASDLRDPHAKQIWIEHPLFAVQLVGDVEPLRQDLFVSPRAGHA